ncbi:unnamed protein product [Fusarium graminearum]|nr:unnamed protein product [Fusarium graminearum]
MSTRDTLDILAAILAAKGILYVKVNGQNPLLGHTRLISSFRQNPLIKVLLTSINTGAVR